MTKSDLVFIYKSVIRPVLDFASVVYHPMLNNGQVECLEKLQIRAVKVIFGHDASYTDIVQKGLIERLDERREVMFKKFAVKCSKNPRFTSEWFPLAENSGHYTRAPLKYKECAAD